MSVVSTAQIDLTFRSGGSGIAGTVNLRDNLCTNTVYSNLCTNQHVGSNTYKYFSPAQPIYSTLENFLEYEFRIYVYAGYGTSPTVTYVNTAESMRVGTRYTLMYPGSAEADVSYNVPCTIGSHTFTVVVQLWEVNDDTEILRAQGSANFNQTVTIGANSVSAPSLTYSSRQSNQSIGLTVKGTLGTNNTYTYCLVFGKLGSAPTATDYDRKSDYIYIRDSRTIANAFAAPVVTSNQTLYVAVQLVGSVGSTGVGSASTMTITPDSSTQGAPFPSLASGTTLKLSGNNWALGAFALNKTPMTTTMVANGLINSSGIGSETNGYYYYIKFTSGLMIGCLKRNVTITLGTGDGEMGNSTYTTGRVNIGTWPSAIAFTSLPSMQACVEESSGGGDHYREWIHTSGFRTEQSNLMMQFYGAQAGTKTVTVCIFAIGAWK